MILTKSLFAQHIGRVLGLLVFVGISLPGRAQVGPAMRSAPSLHIFGTYTKGSSINSSNGDNSSYGYSLGGFGQTAHLWGLEARGSWLHWGNNENRLDALFGPRFTVHRARFAPYVSALGGAGHSILWHTVDSNRLMYVSATGGEWKVAGGVDFYWHHRVSIRLGEVSVSRIYAFQNPITAIDYSGGIVYRLPVWGH